MFLDVGGRWLLRLQYLQRTVDGELALLGIAIERPGKVLRLDEALPIHDGRVVHRMRQCDGTTAGHRWHKVLPVEGRHAVGCIAIVDDAERACLGADGREGIIVAVFFRHKGSGPTLQHDG